MACTISVSGIKQDGSIVVLWSFPSGGVQDSNVHVCFHDEPKDLSTIKFPCEGNTLPPPVNGWQKHIFQKDGYFTIAPSSFDEVEDGSYVFIIHDRTTAFAHSQTVHLSGGVVSIPEDSSTDKEAGIQATSSGSSKRRRTKTQLYTPSELQRRAKVIKSSDEIAALQRGVPRQVDPSPPSPSKAIAMEQEWAQCSSCSKWRRLPHHSDPQSLPEVWLCSMDPIFASCDVPEDELETQEVTLAQDKEADPVKDEDHGSESPPVAPKVAPHLRRYGDLPNHPLFMLTLARLWMSLQSTQREGKPLLTLAATGEFSVNEDGQKWQAYSAAAISSLKAEHNTDDEGQEDGHKQDQTLEDSKWSVLLGACETMVGAANEPSISARKGNTHHVPASGTSQQPPASQPTIKEHQSKPVQASPKHTPRLQAAAEQLVELLGRKQTHGVAVPNQQRKTFKPKQWFLDRNATSNAHGPDSASSPAHFNMKDHGSAPITSQDCGAATVK